MTAQPSPNAGATDLLRASPTSTTRSGAIALQGGRPAGGRSGTRRRSRPRSTHAVDRARPRYDRARAAPVTSAAPIGNWCAGVMSAARAPVRSAAATSASTSTPSSSTGTGHRCEPGGRGDLAHAAPSSGPRRAELRVPGGAQRPRPGAVMPSVAPCVITTSSACRHRATSRPREVRRRRRCGRADAQRGRRRTSSASGAASSASRTAAAQRARGTWRRSGTPGPRSNARTAASPRRRVAGGPGAVADGARRAATAGAPTPTRASRTPSATSCPYASVTTQRETPSVSASVRLGGSAAPGRKAAGRDGLAHGPLEPRRAAGRRHRRGRGASPTRAGLVWSSWHPDTRTRTVRETALECMPSRSVRTLASQHRRGNTMQLPHHRRRHARRSTSRPSASAPCRWARAPTRRPRSRSSTASSRPAARSSTPPTTTTPGAAATAATARTSSARWLRRRGGRDRRAHRHEARRREEGPGAAAREHRRRRTSRASAPRSSSGRRATSLRTSASTASTSSTGTSTTARRRSPRPSARSARCSAEGLVGITGISNVAVWRVVEAREEALRQGVAPYGARAAAATATCTRRPELGPHERRHRPSCSTTRASTGVDGRPPLAVTAYSPLHQGAFARADKPLWGGDAPPDQRTSGCGAARGRRATIGATPNQVALAWLLGGEVAGDPGRRGVDRRAARGGARRSRPRPRCRRCARASTRP